MKLPETNPRDDPEGLWALQLELLKRANAALGPRDASKKIYQPEFTDRGPCIRPTRNPDGAVVELSRSGETFWPTVVFEMAHETVHLLNPVSGNTNYLEQGVAVEFSLFVQPLYGINVPVPLSERLYIHALQLVSVLPRGSLEAAKRVRERVGAMSAATVEDLRELFPSADVDVLSKLAEEFERDIE